MKIALYDPYFDTVGGGERYVATIAEYFSRWHDVVFLWDDPLIVNNLARAFKLDLSKVKTAPNIYEPNVSRLKKFLTEKSYDRLFYLSDGSFPLPLAKKSYLHFQFPVSAPAADEKKAKFKLSKYRKIICNSQYTKNFIDKNFRVQSTVLYPPVDVAKFHSGVKENIILSVGRFTKDLQNGKKQDVLIEAFSELYARGVKNWKLVLAGSLKKEEEYLVANLKHKAAGYPVEILPNLDFLNLVDLYGRAAIYWHAAGFLVDTAVSPEKTEHFGMAIVESMAAGCIPFVVDNGGQKEIVQDGLSGFYYHDIDELVNKTVSLIEGRVPFDSIISYAKERSKLFSKEKFQSEISSIMEI